MPRRSGLIVSIASVLLLTGCAGDSTMTARSVEYRSLEDGTRVAVAEPVSIGAGPAQVDGLVRIDDLAAGDLVLIRDVGRGWDQPQWMPDTEVVSRAGER